MWACRPTRFGEGAAGIGSLFGRPYRPPLRRGSGLVRRAGCPHPAKLGPGITELAIIATLSGRIYNPPLQTHAVPVSAVGAHYICARDHHGLRAARPGHGGMWACRPTEFDGSAAGIGSLFGRPYRPPLRRGSGLVRRAGCPHPAKLGPGITELAIIATLSGRIYNPPLQTHAVPVSAVGAHYICARDHHGLRAARPGHGGMWACRPTAFGGARQEPRVRPCAGCEPPVNFLFRPFTRWVKWSKID